MTLTFSHTEQPAWTARSESSLKIITIQVTQLPSKHDNANYNMRGSVNRTKSYTGTVKKIAQRTRLTRQAHFPLV